MPALFFRHFSGYKIFMADEVPSLSAPSRMNFSISSLVRMPPAASQKRENTQYLLLLVTLILSPSNDSVWSSSASGSAVNSGFHSWRAWLPSQYGFFCDAPQRHNAVGSLSVENRRPSRKYQLSPYSLDIMDCMANGGCPNTRYGPFVVMRIRKSGDEGCVPCSIFCFVI